MHAVGLKFFLCDGQVLSGQLLCTWMVLACSVTCRFLASTAAQYTQLSVQAIELQDWMKFISVSVQFCSIVFNLWQYPSLHSLMLLCLCFVALHVWLSVYHMFVDWRWWYISKYFSIFYKEKQLMWLPLPWIMQPFWKWYILFKERICS